VTSVNQLPPLPKGWLRTQIQDISETTSGGTPSRKNKGFFSGDIPWLKSGELADNLNVNSAEEAITPQALDNSSAKIMPKGSLLVALYGATVGKLGLLTIDAAINQAICAIQPYQGVYPKYLFWYLSSYRKNFLNARKGGAQPNISQEIVRTALVPLAPTAEQLRIIAKVEELFSFLDTGVESLRKVKAQLKRYRQAVSKYAFEGKLTEEWRKTHKQQTEPAIKLLERVRQERREKLGTRYKEPLSIDASELPELPESWVWARLADVSKTTSGGTPSRKKKEYYCGKIPWLKSGELKDTIVDAPEESITDEGLANSSTRIIPKGTLLIALYGATVGKLGILGIDSAINQAICAIMLNGGVSRNFLFWYLRQHRDELLNIRKGGAQPNISQDVVRNIVLPLPPLLEQRKIEEEVESGMSLIYEVETVLKKSLKQAERLRQGILKQAFEGKLVPQDPNDEPAEKLLERVKAERAKSKGEKDTNSKNKSQLELSTYVK